MRGFFMGEPFTGSPADLQYISYDENTTAKQLVDNMNGSVAPVETTSTASRPYTVGKRLTYRGQLYKVTQAIAQGGTLTPGTNIAVDSVDDELTAINTNLSNIKVSTNSQVVNIVTGAGGGIQLDYPSGTSFSGLVVTNGNSPIVSAISKLSNNNGGTNELLGSWQAKSATATQLKLNAGAQYVRCMFVISASDSITFSAY